METKQPDPAPTRSQVEAYLQRALQEVRSWPEWKRHLLGPATPEERERRLRIIKERKQAEEKQHEDH